MDKMVKGDRKKRILVKRKREIDIPTFQVFGMSFIL
jgi:hypothetical protein